MLAVVTHGDLSVLFVLLALCVFGLAGWLVFTGRLPAAAVAAVIGVLILLYG